MLRYDNGVAARAQNNMAHRFGEMELQKLILVTRNRSRSEFR